MEHATATAPAPRSLTVGAPAATPVPSILEAVLRNQIKPRLGMAPGVCRRLYGAIATDPTPERTALHTEALVALAATPASIPLGWNLAIHAYFRPQQIDEGPFTFAYVGSAADCAALHALHPGTHQVNGTDKRKGPGNIVLATHALPPADLVDGRRMIPATDPARGQLLIDLAAAIDAPCLIACACEQHPDLGLLHRCPTKPGAWRMTYCDTYGVSSHEYPDRMFREISTVPGMLGNRAAREYRFVGHRPMDINQRLLGEWRPPAALLAWVDRYDA